MIEDDFYATLKLKTGEETDKLRDLQTDGIEIQNMMMLQQMGLKKFLNN